MEKKPEIIKKDLIDKKLILPSFISKEYLEQKFNELKENQKEELNNDLNDTKIIIENKKLTIFQVDKANNLENKIYEADDFTEVIKKQTKIEGVKDNFDFNLVKNMKNGIFIIASKNMITYGAFFFIKYNKSNKDIEIISEEKERQIQFITEYSDGNFAYKSYIHRPVYTVDSFNVFNINKNEKFNLINFGEYDGAFDSKFISLKNGFAFNNFLCFSADNSTSYLNIVDGFNLKRYICDFVGEIKELISDNNFIYLLSNKEDNSVYIFNIENKKFYSKCFKIWSDMKEPEEIEYEEEQNEKENKNENNLKEKEQNLKEKKNSNKKKKKCVIF